MQDYVKQSVACLVTRVHSPKKVKRTFEKIRKMRKTEARVRKQKTVDRNTIILPAEYNLRGPDVNAIVKIHEHVLKNNTVLKELFPTNIFIVVNERPRNLHELVACADRYNIKTDLLNQTDHGYKKYKRKSDFCNNFFLEKT